MASDSNGAKSEMFILCQKAKCKAPETTFVSHADSTFSASISFGPHLHPSLAEVSFSSGPGLKRKREAEENAACMALSWMKIAPLFSANTSQPMSLFQAVTKACNDKDSVSKDREASAGIIDARENLKDMSHDIPLSFLAQSKVIRRWIAQNAPAINKTLLSHPLELVSFLRSQLLLEESSQKDVSSGIELTNNGLSIRVSAAPESSPSGPMDSSQSQSDSGGAGEMETEGSIKVVLISADPKALPQDLDLPLDSSSGSRLSRLLSEALSTQVFNLLPHGRVGIRLPFASLIPSHAPPSFGENGGRGGDMEIEAEAEAKGTSTAASLNSNQSIIEHSHGQAIMDFDAGQAEVNTQTDAGAVKVKDSRGRGAEDHDFDSRFPSDDDRRSLGYIPCPFLYSSMSPPLTSDPAHDDIKAHINIRASCIAGRPVYGDCILTRARAELHSDRATTLIRNEAYQISDLCSTLTACFPSSCYVRSLSSLCGSTNSCILQLPVIYKRESWVGPKPKALLESYMSRNDATLIWEVEAGQSVGIKAVRCHYHNNKLLAVASRPSRLSNGSSDDAEQEASVALIHLIEAHDALLLSPLEGAKESHGASHPGDGHPPLPQPKSLAEPQEVEDSMDVEDMEDQEEEMESEGSGARGIKGGTIIRMTYRVTVEETGSEVENGQCNIIVGAGCVIPELESSVLQTLALGQGSSGMCSLFISLSGSVDPFSCFPRVKAQVHYSIIERKAPGSMAGGGGGTPGLFQPSLGKLRISTMVQSLTEHLKVKAEHKSEEGQGAFSLLDLGCGSCKFLSAFISSQLASSLPRRVNQVGLTGIDISAGGLKAGVKALKAIQMTPEDKSRININLYQGNVLSLPFADPLSWGSMRSKVDVVTMIEVIEHLEPLTLGLLGPAILGGLQPHTFIVSTPNWAYNRVMRESEKIIARSKGPEVGGGGGAWPGPPDRNGDPMRCNDHKFEWTVKELRHWALPLAKMYGYSVKMEMIGHTVNEAEAIKLINDPPHHGFGGATQICTFEKQEAKGEADEHTTKNHQDLVGLSLVWSSSAVVC